MASKKKADGLIEIIKITHQEFGVRIFGDTPLIYNAMSAKAKQDLLFPPNEAEKKRRKEMGILKHEPVAEYRECVYGFRDDSQPTRLLFPGGGMKAAIAQAAVDLPGAARAQIGRLCHVVEPDIPIWGLPQLYMAVVNCHGTPDIRTRAILPEWCAEFSVRFVTPNLRKGAVGNLIAAAGKIVGIGDFRPQKGKGNFGTFSMIPKGHKGFARLLKTGGREAQDDALLNYTCYDRETEELLAWFQRECLRQEVKDPRVWIGDQDEVA